MFQFIHAADVHLDSPLKGLHAYEGAPVERLTGATREAFANLVQLALDEEVAFVVIAGDLFDTEWQDMRTGLWLAGEFRKLARAGIPTFLIRGNHDAASKVRSKLEWPQGENGEAMVREFSDAKPQTFYIEELGVALHGRGMPTKPSTSNRILPKVTRLPEKVVSISAFSTRPWILRMILTPPPANKNSRL
jgi:exonuclease SbcD